MSRRSELKTYQRIAERLRAINVDLASMEREDLLLESASLLQKIITATEVVEMVSDAERRQRQHLS